MNNINALAETYVRKLDEILSDRLVKYRIAAKYPEGLQEAIDDGLGNLVRLSAMFEAEYNAPVFKDLKPEEISRSRHDFDKAMVSVASRYVVSLYQKQ